VTLVEAVCVVCGTAGVQRKPSDLKRVRPVCSRKCQSVLASGANWRGGRYIEPGKGYVMVYLPGHPRARKNHYVCEHILVMEAHLGRPLAPGECVHHRNRVKHDNRIENLQLFVSNGEHHRHGHGIQRLTPCAVCGRPSRGRQLCEAHYQAAWKRTRTHGMTWAGATAAVQARFQAANANYQRSQT
jgi:endogenous inhibitor of DNA gyrase (YacG/DUF329 family)